MKKITSENAKEMGRKGGQASGVARRENAIARDFALKVFSTTIPDEDTGEPITAREALVRRLFRKAYEEGDLATAKYLFELVGESPTQMQKDDEVSRIAEAYGVNIEKSISSKVSYIRKLLTQEGKYTADLTYQVKIAATLMVRTEVLARAILSPGYNPINTEISREGNKRQTVNPTEPLYLQYVGKTQSALRALGMNTDSRERKSDGGDGLTDFLNAMKE